MSNPVVTGPISTETLNVNDTLQLKYGFAAGCQITQKLNISSDGVLRIDGNGSFPGGLQIDTISAHTSSEITINGNLCTSGVEMIKTDNVYSNGPSVGFANPILADTVNETTTDSGVTINGSLIKDGNFFVNGTDQAEIVSHKNIPNGYVGLDINGKISSALLPLDNIVFIGTWNANTNMPHLASSVGTAGNLYIVSTPGNTNLDGINVWATSDAALFDGTTWLKIQNSQLVNNVNGLFGVVNLTTTDIPQGVTNKWYTDELVSANSSVLANNAHVANTSNPHNVTPSDLGNTVAQWNVSQIQDVSINNVSPSDGQILEYNGSMWTPVNPPSGVTFPQLMLCAFNSQTLPKPTAGPGPGSFGMVYSSWDLINPNNIGFVGSSGTWTFPVTGLYKITWGASLHYTGSGFQNVDVRLNISPSTLIQAFAQQTNIDVNLTDSVTGVWAGVVTAGTTGSISSYVFSLSTGVSVVVDNYYIYIEQWA